MVSIGTFYEFIVRMIICKCGTAFSPPDPSFSRRGVSHPGRDRPPPVREDDACPGGLWLKRRYNASLTSNLYFWRDNVGTEVDIIVEEGGVQRPIEIKSSHTVTAELIAGLKKWLRYAGAQATTAMLVYAGDESYTRAGIEVRSWRTL